MTAPLPSTLTSAQMADSIAAFYRLRELSQLRSSRPLTESELSELENVPACTHCGGFHARACPRVRRIAFHPGSGAVAEVEYWPSSKVKWDGVMFEDQGADPAETGLVPVSLVRSVLGPFRRGRDSTAVYIKHTSEAWKAAMQLLGLLDLIEAAAVQSGNDSTAGQPAGRTD